MAKGSTVLGHIVRGVVGEIVGRELYGEQIWSKRMAKGTMKSTTNMNEWRRWEGACAQWLSIIYPLYKRMACWPTFGKNLWTQWLMRNLANCAPFPISDDKHAFVQTLTWDWDFQQDMGNLNFFRHNEYEADINWTQCWQFDWPVSGHILVAVITKNYLSGVSFYTMEFPAPMGNVNVQWPWDIETPIMWLVTYYQDPGIPCALPFFEYT